MFWLLLLVANNFVYSRHNSLIPVAARRFEPCRGRSKHITDLRKIGFCIVQLRGNLFVVVLYVVC